MNSTHIHVFAFRMIQLVLSLSLERWTKSGTWCPSGNWPCTDVPRWFRTQRAVNHSNRLEIIGEGDRKLEVLFYFNWFRKFHWSSQKKRRWLSLEPCVSRNGGRVDSRYCARNPVSILGYPCANLVSWCQRVEWKRERGREREASVKTNVNSFVIRCDQPWEHDREINSTKEHEFHEGRDES